MSYKIPLLFTLSSAALAVGDEKLWPEHKPENFCTDPDKVQNNESLARKHPRDERLVKLVALRTGLCDLIEKKIIDLDIAIDLFENERQNQVIKRMQEDTKPDIKL